MEPNGLDFIGLQYGNQGQKIGVKIAGDIFFPAASGVVLTDRTTGKYYRLFVDNGTPAVEEITLDQQ